MDPKPPAGWLKMDRGAAEVLLGFIRKPATRSHLRRAELHLEKAHGRLKRGEPDCLRDHERAGRGTHEGHGRAGLRETNDTALADTLFKIKIGVLAKQLG